MPSFTNDIAALTASLTFDGSSPAAVAFTAGGVALLIVPGISVDGKSFKVTVGGNVTLTDTTNLPSVILSLGNGSVLTAALSAVTLPSSNTGTHSFLIEADVLWSSVSEELVGFYRGAAYSGTQQSGAVAWPGLASQSALEFFVYSNSNTGSPFSSDVTIALTEFSIKFDN